MNEINVLKGVQSLKRIAENIRAILDFCRNNNIDYLLPYIEQMQDDGMILTHIFETEFENMIAEKERMEDDGK